MNDLQRVIAALAFLWTAFLFALYIFNYYKLYTGGA